MPVGMGGGNFVVSVPGNLDAFRLMRQIIIDFIQ